MIIMGFVFGAVSLVLAIIGKIKSRDRERQWSLMALGLALTLHITYIVGLIDQENQAALYDVGKTLLQGMLVYSVLSLIINSLRSRLK